MIAGIAIRHRESGAVFAITKPARHCHAIHELADCGEAAWAKGEQGFITSDGKFLNRWQAARYALRTGQTERLVRDELISEDVW